MHALDDLRGADLLIRRFEPVRGGDVVATLQQQHPAHARLVQHIALQARQRTRPAIGRHAVVEDAIAGDAGVHHGDGRQRRITLQPLREPIGPARIGVFAGAHAIGDRIAQHDEGARARWRGDFQIGQQVAGIVGFAFRFEPRPRGEIAPRQVHRLVADLVDGRRGRALRQVQTDGEHLQCRHRQIHRVTQDRPSRRERHLRQPGERHRSIAVGLDGDTVRMPGQPDRTDREWLAAEQVGQAHADRRSAQAGANHLAYRHRRQRVSRPHRRRTPTGDPVMVVVAHGRLCLDGDRRCQRKQQAGQGKSKGSRREGHAGFPGWIGSSRPCLAATGARYDAGPAGPKS